MRLIKKNSKILITFVLGIIFGSVGVYAGSMLNSQEIAFKPSNNKWQATNVESALNDLYSNAGSNYDEYNGTTSVTPTYENITLNTQDKLVKNNITISGIPLTYKNLNSETTAISENILTGKTAYNSDGQLMTGSLSTACLSGTYNHVANSQINIELGFVPTRFMLSFFISSTVFISYDSNFSTTGVFQTIPNGGTVTNLADMYTISTNIRSNYSTTANSYKNAYTVYYMACK